MLENQVIIRRYEITDEIQLFALLEREGEEWSGYWRGIGREKYKKALGDNYPYYEKLGYAMEGTVYIVKTKL